MTKKLVKTNEHLERAIFIVRGERVMLDQHLADLYAVDTRTLTQSVRRNLDRFPPDFMFELTRDELAEVSQSLTSSSLLFPHRVTVFTDHGVAMLASVLRSKRALATNVETIRTFVRLRQILSSNEELAHQLQELEGMYNRQCDLVFNAIRLLIHPRQPQRKEISFSAAF